MSAAVELARAAIGAGGVIGLVALLRRRRAALTASPLAVVARAPLSREAGLAVVEVDGRRLVVGWGAGGVRLLSTDGGAP